MCRIVPFRLIANSLEPATAPHSARVVLVVPSVCTDLPIACADQSNQSALLVSNYQAVSQTIPMQSDTCPVRWGHPSLTPTEPDAHHRSSVPSAHRRKMMAAHRTQCWSTVRTTSTESGARALRHRNKPSVRLSWSLPHCRRPLVQFLPERSGLCLPLSPHHVLLAHHGNETG